MVPGLVRPAEGQFQTEERVAYGGDNGNGDYSYSGIGQSCVFIS